MPIDLRLTAYGPPAAQALRDAVAAAKEHDPLAPVSVVVPANSVGVAARRQLASGVLGGVSPRGRGVAGITFLTLYRMAELLGAPRLAADGRRPVSSPVLAAALRGVLARDPGRFTAVADHPSTEAALVDAYRELSRCNGDALDALSRTGARAADLLRITRAALPSLEPRWYDEADLMAAAVTAIEQGTPVLADLGAIVLYLPLDVTDAGAAMVRAASARSRVAVIVGSTGVPRADAEVCSSLARLGVAVGSTAEEPIEPPHGTSVVSVSDPDEEVRAAVRMVVGAVRAGVPLDRMAILYGARDPYARIVHEQLAAAGIPHSGAAVRTVAESVAGRALLGLLALADRDFHRHDVMALITSVPIRVDGRPVPSARWERISRRAGVVRGGTSWEERLGRHARVLERQLGEELTVPDREPRPDWFRHELDATRSLAAFVRDAREALAWADQPGRSWSELVEWARRLLRRFLGGPAAHAAWPADEIAAVERVDAALERLGGLDAVGPAPGAAVFRRTLALELDQELGRIGRLGEGVLTGPVSLGVGLDIDRLYVCGLAEGTFPTRAGDDSLLPDADRRATTGALPLRSARADREHARFLAALASARDERVLLFPRGDLRRTRERMPSRFLLDTVEALDGRRRYADDLHHLDADWFTVVPSFASGIARTEFPASEQEYRLRALLDHCASGASVTAHELVREDRALARALECSLARASRAFTRFDGNLSALSVPSPATDDVVVSPTSLERWARSPHTYFMERVLRVEIPELPEEVYELSPLDRGSLVHEILDEFVREALTRPGGPPSPGSSWSAADRARLHEIAAARCREYEADGLTGRRVFWRRDRERLMADLDRFLAADDDVRREHGITTLATELRFGFGDRGDDALVFTLSDGRVLRFRGAADRVDMADDGVLWVVDYKTGRADAIDPDDPTSRGTRLQLPVYARAAQAAFADRADRHTRVGAAYWFVSSRGDFRWAELELTGAVEARVDHVLRAIVDGIEHGVFPCRLDPPSSYSFHRRSFDDPDARGTRDRYREWERKRDAPELAAYVALAEPELTLEALA